MLWRNPKSVSLLYPFYYGLLLLRSKLPRLWMGVPYSLGAAIISVEEGLTVETIIGGNVLLLESGFSLNSLIAMVNFSS
jgi:hypothetical protein